MKFVVEIDTAGMATCNDVAKILRALAGQIAGLALDPYTINSDGKLFINERFRIVDKQIGTFKLVKSDAEIIAKPVVGDQLVVDGITDPVRDVRYLGVATFQPDGTWRALANVAGALCVVEATIAQPTKKSIP